jgi:hypothetical protein
MSAKPITQTVDTDTNDRVEVEYPRGYYGQNLGEDYIFITASGAEAMATKNAMPFHYLQKFVEEVALRKSRRSKQYLQAYEVGQRFLWDFADEQIVLLSLVVLLPIGPRTVMSVGTKSELLDPDGKLEHHTELIIRWGIEAHVGTAKL